MKGNGNIKEERGRGNFIKEHFGICYTVNLQLKKQTNIKTALKAKVF